MTQWTQFSRLLDFSLLAKEVTLLNSNTRL